VSVLAVVGLKREAMLVAGPDIDVVIGGGNSALLRQRLDLSMRDDVRGIISIGIAGALSPSLNAGDCIVASAIVADSLRFDTDNEWSAHLRQILPGPMAGTIAGAERIAATAEEKLAIYRETGADAVDMESHVAAGVAREHNLPFVALRAISDRADHTLPHAARVAMKPSGGIALGRVLQSVVTRPQQIPALVRTNRETEKAFSALLRCLDLLGPGFGCPYLSLL
jgi:adenosylhomocysteine nucleosidase